MIRLIFHPQAKSELDRAVAWYGTRPELGDRFRQAVEDTLSRIEQYPLAYPKLRGRWRRALVSEFPYGVIYNAAGETTYILACFHGHRNPRRWQERL